MENKLLINLALKELPLADSFKMVQAYWDIRLGWKWEALVGLLPFKRHSHNNIFKAIQGCKR